jgi:bifunctional enzyme CysN/CysC
MIAHPPAFLRFVTTGSVDDGKSTLIGRLLYETNAIFEDQYEAIRKTSLRRGQTEADLSLLLDGLAAEREQAITIDVAYRYFSTSKRKFIIADAPGHEQYTRNMVTGASTAELAIILINARKGVLTQSKRHGFLVSLLRIPHLIVGVNKMDLVDYSEAVFRSIVDEFTIFSQRLDIHDILFIPVSALKGDNIAALSANTPWYDGLPLLHYLENVHTAGDRNLIDFRFPVQCVIRPNHDFRGFAGCVVSGTIRPGEEVLVLPAGKVAAIKSLVTYYGELPEASAGQPIVMTFDREIDVGRGDMIVRGNNLPLVGNSFEAILCWLDDESMTPGKTYLLKHTTRSVSAVISRVVYRIDVNTLHRQKADTFQLNEIGRVDIRTLQPIFCDPYRINRATGAFILIDPLTNNTVAAGLIRGATQSVEGILGELGKESARHHASPHTAGTGLNIARETRERRHGHKAAVLWLTGYSGSGKSSIAKALEKRLFDTGHQATLLDGDNVRQGLCGDLGFSDTDRLENIRRVGEVTKLFFENGAILIAAFISPLESQRNLVRSMIPAGRFFEIYVRCSLEICKQRDPRGLYQKASAGEIPDFTGVSSPYQEPQHPDIVLDTERNNIEECVDIVIGRLRENEIV